MTARVVLPGASDEKEEVDTDEEATEEEKGTGDNDGDLLQHFPDETEARGRLLFCHPPTYGSLLGFRAIALKDRISGPSSFVAICESFEETLFEAKLYLIPGPCNISSTHTAGRT